MEPLRPKNRFKLYHTKSRWGCRQCRRRRVKCDEARPVCNNCHRHDVVCQYDTRPRGEAPRSRPSTVLPAPIVHNNSYWEMRLFHHFTIATSNTLPGSHLSAVKECWAVQVPILALDDRQALWNSMLALAGRHMVAQGCKDNALMVCHAAVYTTALETYRPLLDNLSPQNIDAACLTSILLLVDVFSTLQYRRLDVYEPPIDWLRIVQGTRAVFEASYGLVEAKTSSQVLTIITSYTESRHYHSSQQETLADLAHLTHPDVLTEHAHKPGFADIYIATVRRISSILSAIKAGEPPESLARGLMAFPCTAPAEFLDLVAQREPLAIIILGHFFALSRSAQHLWWVGGTPHREVEAICRTLPPQHVALMDWPRKYLRQ